MNFSKKQLIKQMHVIIESIGFVVTDVPRQPLESFLRYSFGILVSGVFLTARPGVRSVLKILVIPGGDWTTMGAECGCCEMLLTAVCNMLGLECTV